MEAAAVGDHASFMKPIEKFLLIFAISCGVLSLLLLGIYAYIEHMGLPEERIVQGPIADEVSISPIPTPAPVAHKLAVSLDLPEEQSDLLLDEDYWTDTTFIGGTITVRSEKPIAALYLIWGSYVGEWTLEIGGESFLEGENSFLHEFIAIENPSCELAIRLPAGVSTTLCDIYAYSEGVIPEDIQRWQPSCEKADLLAFSTHADDEFVFFGGIIPYYAVVRDKNVQVVYMTTNYYDEDDYRVRVHEVLNGLWTAGVQYYPVTNMQPDHLAKTLKEAEEMYGTEQFREFQVEQIRRFKPEVIVTQDHDGEYGHGVHQLNVRSLEWAVYAAADSLQYPELAERYGTWNTPKTYLHLYGSEGERTILDYETPSEKLDGLTPYEVACLAYAKHETQQKWDFEVYSFDSEYDSHSFGLFRTLVGPDEAKNDLFEHIN